MKADGLNRSREGGDCPSEFGLEGLRLGETAGSESGRLIAAHVAHCASCAERLVDLRRAPPPFALDAVWQAARGNVSVKVVPQGARGKRPDGRWLLTQGFAVAAFGTVALVALALFRAPSRVPADLTKGSAWNLTVFAKPRGQAVAYASSGVRLSEGDQLRFEVSTTWERGYAAIIGLDSAGAVSALAPSDGQAIEVRAGQRLLLDGAVELDGSPGAERIELIGCPQPFAMTTLIAAARVALTRQDLQKLGPLRPGCHHQTFWIEKAQR
jgi:hypothetical protein